jgi:ribose transport system ATP-binding protein
MDEPTSSLSQGETDQLYRVIKDLRSRQVSVVYISHRLGEVKELADRVIVLRDGRNAGELSREQINHEAMVKLMVGRAIPHGFRRGRSGKTVEVSGLVPESDSVGSSPGQFKFEIRALRTPVHPRFPLSFTLRPGEIVGIAGLVGAGRSELLRALFGVDRAVGGDVFLGGRRLDLQSPRDAIRAGLALVPEDRKSQGVILEMAVGENTILPSLNRLSRGGFRRPTEEKEVAQTLTRRLKVKTPNLDLWVQFLSGGNQQKVVLAKWLALEPKVLLLDEPTRGIDVGAKQEIYILMEGLAERGLMILFASSEMEEVLRMSDRVLVMHQGRIRGELDSGEMSEEAIMDLATGKEPA